MKKAEKGNTVKVHYKGMFEDGTVFDSSENRDPLQFTLGSGQLIPGFDSGVTGMELNEKKTVNIPAADAYGERHDNLVMKLPKTNLPEGFDPHEGQQLQMKNKDGNEFIVTVTEVLNDSITIDANHPFAGKNLTFDIELLEISA